MEKDKLKQVLIIFGLAVSVICFFYFTDIASNKYHFSDDHEFYRINADIQNLGFSTALKNWIFNDFNIRFRPFYYFQRVIEVYICGVDYSKLYLYNIVIAIFTIVFGFFGIRNFGFSTILSLLFLLITFLGLQLEIWWRLGPAENIGTLLFFISFYLSSLSLSSIRNKIIFCISVILCSLSKESFTLLIPFFIFMRLYKNNGKDDTWRELLLRNKYLFILLIVFLVEIYVIKSIGMNKIGYAGVDDNLSNLYVGIVNILNGNIKDLLIAIGIIFTLELIIASSNSKGECKHFFKSNTLGIIGFLLIFIPNVLIYAKSGMNNRYLIPTTIGLSLIIVFLLKNTFDKRIWIFYLILIFFGLKVPFSNMKMEIARYNQEGKDIALVTKAFSENINKNSKVLFVADPSTNYEPSISLYHNLSLGSGIQQIYVHPISLPNSFDSNFNQKLHQDWFVFFQNRQLSDLKSKPDFLFFFNNDLISKFNIDSLELNPHYSQVINCMYKLK